MKKLLSVCLTFILLMSCAVIPADAAAVVDKAEGTIDANAGEFVITFDDAAAAEAAFDAITFKKEGGAEIKGGAFKEIDALNPDKVIVKYGTLEDDQNYVLNVDGTEYEYTADIFEFRETFDGYNEEDSLTKPDSITEPTIYYPGHEISTGQNVNSGATSGYDVHSIEKENNDTFVRLDVTEADKGKNGRIVLELPTVLTAPEFCLRVKIRPSGACRTIKGIWTFYWHKDSLSIWEKFAMVDMSSGTAVNPTGSTDVGTSTLEPASIAFNTVDADGFYNFSVHYKKGADGKYTQTLRNINAPEEGTFKLTPPKSTYDGVHGFWLTQFYKAAADAEGYIDLSEVELVAEKETGILYNGFADMNDSDDTFKVVFTNDMNEKSLSAVTMKDAAGEDVRISYVEDSYNAEERSASFKLGEILDEGAEYTLSFADAADYLGRALASDSASVTVQAPSSSYSIATTAIEDENGTAIAEIGDAGRLRYITTINAEAGAEFTLVLVVMSKTDGRVLGIVSDTAAVAEGETSVELDAITSENINLGASNCYVKPLVWCNDATMEALLLDAPAVIE